VQPHPKNFPSRNSRWSTSAGRDMRNLVLKTCLAIAAAESPPAYYCNSAIFSGFNSASAIAFVPLAKVIHFKYTHWSVPNYGLWFKDFFSEQFNCFQVLYPIRILFEGHVVYAYNFQDWRIILKFFRNYNINRKKAVSFLKVFAFKKNFLCNIDLFGFKEWTPISFPSAL